MMMMMSLIIVPLLCVLLVLYNKLLLFDYWLLLNHYYNCECSSCIVSYFQYRRMLKKKSTRYIDRVSAKRSLDDRHSDETYKVDPTDTVFQT